MTDTYIPQPGRRISICEMQQIRNSGKDGGEQTAPTYAILPSGERVYRFFWIGVLTDTKKDPNGNITGFLADPTGMIRMRVHPQYQEKAFAALSLIEAPQFIAVSAKVNIYAPPDAKSDEIYVTLKPDDLAVVTKIDRLLWTQETLAATDNRYPDPPEWWINERGKMVCLIEDETQLLAVPA
jgi:hypothetical protein